MKSRSSGWPDVEARDDEDIGPSKTEVKQAMHELQDLGVALLELPQVLLDELDMEDRLRDALAELRRLKSFEAIRRQSQFIGKMLREADPEPFRRALAAHRQGQHRALLQAEEWRTRLLAEDAAITQWVAAHPATDVQQLRALIRNVRREQAQRQGAAENGEPVSRGRSKLYRELFQVLRSALLGEIAVPAEPQPPPERPS
jgi:ribosome-associated protein